MHIACVNLNYSAPGYKWWLLCFLGQIFQRAQLLFRALRWTSSSLKGPEKVSLPFPKKDTFENDMPTSLQFSKQNSNQCYHFSSRVEVVQTIIVKSLKTPVTCFVTISTQQKKVGFSWIMHLSASFKKEQHQKSLRDTSWRHSKIMCGSIPQLTASLTTPVFSYICLTHFWVSINRGLIPGIMQKLELILKAWTKYSKK